MSLKRTSVYANAEDLEYIKEAAARLGVSQAAIIREGIHLVAMPSSSWDEPPAWPMFEGSGTAVFGDEVSRTVAHGAADS